MGVHICRTCPVSIDVCAKVGKQEPSFSAQAWQPSTYNRAHVVLRFFTTHDCCARRHYTVRSCGLEIAAQ